MSDEAVVPQVSLEGIIRLLEEKRKSRKHLVRITSEEDIEIVIGDRQRAQMAMHYPHLYSAPAKDLLEAIMEERASQKVAG